MTPSLAKWHCECDRGRGRNYALSESLDTIFCGKTSQTTGSMVVVTTTLRYQVFINVQIKWGKQWKQLALCSMEEDVRPDEDNALRALTH